LGESDTAQTAWDWDCQLSLADVDSVASLCYSASEMASLPSCWDDLQSLQVDDVQGDASLCYSPSGSDRTLFSISDAVVDKLGLNLGQEAWKLEISTSASEGSLEQVKEAAKPEHFNLADDDEHDAEEEYFPTAFLFFHCTECGREWTDLDPSLLVCTECGRGIHCGRLPLEDVEDEYFPTITAEVASVTVDGSLQFAPTPRTALVVEQPEPPSAPHKKVPVRVPKEHEVASISALESARMELGMLET